jgi:hypothetical protein
VWSASRPGRLYLRERPGTHCTGGWVGPGAGLDRCGKSRPNVIRSPDLPARSESLYQLRYPDESLCILISRSILLRMRNVSDKTSRGNENTHFMFNNFSPENRAVYEIMWGKNCRAKRTTDDNTLLVARSFWVTSYRHILRTCDIYCFFPCQNGYANVP